MIGLSAAALCLGGGASAAPAPPKTLRLYVFDCGLINVNREGVERYNVTPQEVRPRGSRAPRSARSCGRKAIRA
jgi:hypothetical protein